jgi:hypothetical protein
MGEWNAFEKGSLWHGPWLRWHWMYQPRMFSITPSRPVCASICSGPVSWSLVWAVRSCMDMSWLPAMTTLTGKGARWRKARKFST